MFRSLSYAIGFLLASSLTANPLYAGDSRPLDRRPSYEVVADNDKQEKREEERHKQAEEREKNKHERKESRIKEREERNEDRKERREERKERRSKEGKHVSGEQTKSSENPAHASGSTTTNGHISGK